MAQSCLTVAPCTVAHYGIFQARILEWVVTSYSKDADISDPEIEPASLAPPALASRFFPLCHLGSPHNHWYIMQDTIFSEQSYKTEILYFHNNLILVVCAKFLGFQT